jgi:hypothetical protein
MTSGRKMSLNSLNDGEVSDNPFIFALCEYYRVWVVISKMSTQDLGILERSYFLAYSHYKEAIGLALQVAACVADTPEEQKNKEDFKAWLLYNRDEIKGCFNTLAAGMSECDEDAQMRLVCDKAIEYDMAICDLDEEWGEFILPQFLEAEYHELNRFVTVLQKHPANKAAAENYLHRFVSISEKVVRESELFPNRISEVEICHFLGNHYHSLLKIHPDHSALQQSWKTLLETKSRFAYMYSADRDVEHSIEIVFAFEHWKALSAIERQYERMRAICHSSLELAKRKCREAKEELNMGLSFLSDFLFSMFGGVVALVARPFALGIDYCFDTDLNERVVRLEHAADEARGRAENMMGKHPFACLCYVFGLMPCLFVAGVMWTPAAAVVGTSAASIFIGVKRDETIKRLELGCVPVRSGKMKQVEEQLRVAKHNYTREQKKFGAAKRAGQGQENLDLYRRATRAGQERKKRSDPGRHFQRSTFQKHQNSQLAEEFMANMTVDQAQALYEESEKHLASVRVREEMAQREYCALTISGSQTSQRKECDKKTASFQR